MRPSHFILSLYSRISTVVKPANMINTFWWVFVILLHSKMCELSHHSEFAIKYCKGGYFANCLLYCIKDLMVNMFWRKEYNKSERFG